MFVKYLNKIAYNSNSGICCHFITYQYNIWSNTWRKNYINEPVKWREMLDSFSIFNSKEYKSYINSFNDILCIGQTNKQQTDYMNVLHKRISTPVFKMILACDQKLGIGFSNKIPWICKEDQRFFKETTNNNIIICGRRTFDNLPYLKNREIWCITRDKDYTPQHDRNTYKFLTTKTRLFSI